MAIHRAEPAQPYTEDATSVCVHCLTTIRRVPGGHGPTWVHDATGTVVGSGAPIWYGLTDTVAEVERALEAWTETTTDDLSDDSVRDAGDWLADAASKLVAALKGENRGKQTDRS